MLKVGFQFESARLTERFRSLPPRVMATIRGTITKELKETAEHIKRTRLSFPSSGPTTLRGLRAITGNLRRSIKATPVVIVGNSVSGAITSDVEYAKYHEYGTRHLPARAPITKGIKERRRAMLDALRREISKAIAAR